MYACYLLYPYYQPAVGRPTKPTALKTPRRRLLKLKLTKLSPPPPSPLSSILIYPRFPNLIRPNRENLMKECASSVKASRERLPWKIKRSLSPRLTENLFPPQIGIWKRLTQSYGRSMEIKTLLQMRKYLMI